jgi:hypothetical protein
VLFSFTSFSQLELDMRDNCQWYEVVSRQLPYPVLSFVYWESDAHVSLELAQRPPDTYDSFAFGINDFSDL